VVDFIEEVEEQLRSDRYRALARTVLPWAAAVLAIVIVGWLGVWGYNTWQNQNVSKASEQYDKGLQTLATGDETGAFTAFDTVGKSGPAAYKALSLIQQGNIRLAANKTADAVAFYDRAAKAAPNAVIGDLARLKAAFALMDETPYPQLETRLKELIGDKKPYDLQAKEALALAKLQAGKTEDARGDFVVLTLIEGAPDAMRERARAAIAIIDSGQGKVIGEVVKAAATLPPPSPATQGPPLGAPPQGAPAAPTAPAPRAAE